MGRPKKRRGSTPQKIGKVCMTHRISSGRFRVELMVRSGGFTHIVM